ncbi:MAG: EAL domain-containing protein [Chloroflexota bacterium]|nr:MAG: EAL domain-containing protein [Chloroflexota bacterium]
MALGLVLASVFVFLTGALALSASLADWLIAAAVFLATAALFGLLAKGGGALVGRHAAAAGRRAAAETLAASEARLRAALEASADGVLLLDGAGRISFANGAAATLLGQASAAIVGLGWEELTARADLRPAAEAPRTVVPLSGGEGLSLPATLSVGSAGPTWRLLELAVAPLGGGPEAGGTVLTLHEASDARALAREQAAHLVALHDAADELVGAASAADAGGVLLAQLSNAWPVVAGAIYLFAGSGTERLAALWAGAPGPPEPLVPPGTAAALRALATVAPARVALSRLPGPPTGPAQLAGRGARSLLVLALRADGRLIGVLLAGDRQAPEPLAPAEARYLERIAALAAHVVRRALADEEAAGLGRRAEIDAILAAPTRLRPLVQPVLALAGGRVVGFEALARFAGPPDQAPDLWFAQAEAAGRGPALQALALRRARALAAAAGLPRGAFLALNVSPRHLAHPAIAAAIGRGPLGRLVIEITEEEPVADYGALRAAMAPYRARGARFAVDDAGAGFASFRHVTEIRPDFVKLDAFLIAGLAADPARQALVRALTRFAAELGATTIAEGVETTADLAYLRALGGSLLAQGYAIARPGLPWPLVAPAAQALCRSAGARRHAAGAIAVSV